MAHFYGSVSGGRGEATRLGHAKSGLTTLAASYSGAVRVHLYVCNGIDMARVELVRHKGAGTQRPLYDGPVNR